MATVVKLFVIIYYFLIVRFLFSNNPVRRALLLHELVTAALLVSPLHATQRLTLQPQLFQFP